MGNNGYIYWVPWFPVLKDFTHYLSQGVFCFLGNEWGTWLLSELNRMVPWVAEFPKLRTYWHFGPVSVGSILCLCAPDALVVHTPSVLTTKNVSVAKCHLRDKIVPGWKITGLRCFKTIMAIVKQVSTSNIFMKSDRLCIYFLVDIIRLWLTPLPIQQWQFSFCNALCETLRNPTVQEILWRSFLFFEKVL